MNESKIVLITNSIPEFEEIDKLIKFMEDNCIAGYSDEEYESIVDALTSNPLEKKEVMRIFMDRQDHFQKIRRILLLVQEEYIEHKESNHLWT